MTLWNDERAEALVTLWNEGRPSSVIAETLGITRSAVIGKVFRLRASGVKLRGEHERPTGSENSPFRHRKTRLYKKKAPKASGPPANDIRARLLARLAAEARASQIHTFVADDDPPLVTSILNLEDHHCRYPIGEMKADADKFGFCGKDRAFGLPYCGKHARRCFTPDDQGELRPMRMIGWEREPISFEPSKKEQEQKEPAEAA